jgi:hypothetical protein
MNVSQERQLFLPDNLWFSPLRNKQAILISNILSHHEDNRLPAELQNRNKLTLFTFISDLEITEIEKKLQIGRFF